MLRRLSVKFSAAAIAVIFCVELLMTGLINGLNIYYTISEVDEIVDSILENKGKMPENFAPREPRKNDGRRFGELRYSTRYFTVMIDPSGEADFIEENPIKVHPNIIYSTFCGSRMFLFSVSPLSRNL